MTREQILQLISNWQLDDTSCVPELVETHISWVLLTKDFVYKIKKPVHYSFLDFSTVEKRKFYCEREIVLNRRFTDDIYLGVVAVREYHGRLRLDVNEGSILDYAVKMRKLDRSREMDLLVAGNKVSPADIQALAKKIASFHKSADVVKYVNPSDIRDKFNDLEAQAEFLQQNLKYGQSIIHDAIKISDLFLSNNGQVIKRRLKNGFFRDCHGDLHSRNIFLLSQPTPFDCIEFNDKFRQMDVLDEVAFLCMDLDALGRQDLADMFLKSYDSFFPTIQSDEDYQFFLYYKAYRANIRAKVNSLRARSSANDSDRKIPLTEAGKYLKLMTGYLQLLKLPQTVVLKYPNS